MDNKKVVRCMICGKLTTGGELKIQLCKRCANVLYQVIIEKKEIIGNENKA